MKSICVYCGSSSGNNPKFVQAAKDLGAYLAQNGITLVYGGARVGLMGAVADGCIAHGGRVVGVLPKFLRTKEISHEGLSELILVDSMHERKVKMFELSEGFIALPGGIGTLEELCEMLTWQQLGLHQRPIGILNIDNYYSPLTAMFEQMQRCDLLKKSDVNRAIVASSIGSLFEKMNDFVAPHVPKWISEVRQET